MRFPIHIRSSGLALLLDYEVFLDYHGGQALAGAAVGWRAMECAAMLLSDDAIWERNTLSLSARHAGPGVRDALEYVTRCFSRERFQHDAPAGGNPCASAADFRFTVSDGARIVQLQLAEDVIPASFFAAVRRCRDDPDSADAYFALASEKEAAARAVQARAIDQLFACRVTSLIQSVEHRRA
jgi:hypothetical protein